MEQKQVYIVDTCALRKPNAMEILRPLVEAGHEVAVPYQVHRELLRQQGEQALRPEAERSQEPDEALGVIARLELIPKDDTLVDGPADREIFCYCMENRNNGYNLVTQDFKLAFAVAGNCPGVQVFSIGEQVLLPFIDAKVYKMAMEYREVYLSASGMEQFCASPHAWGMVAAVADKGGRVLVPSHSRSSLSPAAAEFCNRMKQDGLLKFMPQLGPCDERQALRARLLAGVTDGKVLLLLGDGDDVDDYRSLNGMRLPCMKRAEFVVGSFRNGEPLVPLPEETPEPAGGAEAAAEPAAPHEMSPVQELSEQDAPVVVPDDLTAIEQRAMTLLEKRQYTQAAEVLNESSPGQVTVSLLKSYLQTLGEKFGNGNPDFSPRFTGKLSKKAWLALVEHIEDYSGAGPCLATLQDWAAASAADGEAKLAASITAIADRLRSKMK